MQKQIIVILFLSLLFYIQQIQSACLFNTTCDCSIHPEGYFELECDPVNNLYGRIALAVAPELRLVKIECKVFTKIEDFVLIPNIQTSSLDTLIVDFCPINENATFIDILHKLGVNSVNTIRYRLAPGMNDTKIIKGDYFHDIQNLTRIEITGNSGTIINSDLLKNSKNILTLILSQNNLTLTSNFFENTTQITSLDINQNEIKELPDHIFDNLADLTSLNIWNTKMETLNENIFEYLENLVVLDLHSNQIKTLPENIFRNLIYLENLNINLNNFTHLPGTLFRKNINLINIRLSNNVQNISLTNGLFSNLPNLKEVLLDHSKIIEVSDDLFSNSSNIVKISLQSNQIEYLPTNIFQDTIQLIDLNLSRNKIKSIPNSLFQNLGQLEELNLSFNQISTFSSENFLHQTNLRKLNFGNNLLKRFGRNVFTRTVNLETLILSHNQLIFDVEDRSFNNLQKLKSLDLAYNLITNICSGWRLTLTSLKMLNLAYNKFKQIEFNDIYFGPHEMTLDLSNNLIEIIDMTAAEFDVYKNNHDAISGRRSNQILISNNPINCSCHIHNLVRYFRDEMDAEVHGMVDLIATDLKCAQPKELKDRNVKKLGLEELFCTIDTDCPNSCNCKARNYDASTIIDCSNRNLTTLPSSLPKYRKFPNITLFINNNNLSNFDINQTNAYQTGYQNIKELYIHNNHLSEINWLPNQLQVVELHSNNFEQINITLLENLTYLRKLTLHNNPWMCTCKNVDLMAFIQKEYFIIQNNSNILCDTASFMNITSNDLCSNSTMAVIGVTMFFIIFTLTITILLITFYQNEEAIRVWLYIHNCCTGPGDEERLDKDKKYDAFVCYSYQDEDFITKQLIPNLEQCEKPFKLCIHNRDWIGGEMIPDQIARTLVESRRTLVVLSPHFFTSTWAKMEFQCAHKNALDEGRTRVIVIKYGDIGPMDKMDPEIRAYLKLHTYIEWGEKGFWDKLRYALPHQPPLNSRAALISKRIKHSLGDTKFELQTVTTTQPTAQPQIIPPESNDKNPLILRELLNNLQKQISNGNHVNRNIA